MELILDDKKLEFKKIEIIISDELFDNVFTKKNNKTVMETINTKRYKCLKNIILNNYSKYMNCELGEFLKLLKEKKDNTYLKFLNPYGDKTYSKFWINDTNVLDKKGLYLFCIDNNIKYIGRCNDTFKKRLNTGYGNISPKNCFLDGQSTNCRINNLITKNKSNLQLYVLCKNNNCEINLLEKSLINEYNPEWNIQI
jgi:hypothetical protein